MVSMTSSGQNGPGSVIGESAGPATGGCDLESSSLSDASQSVVECHNNRNINTTATINNNTNNNAIRNYNSVDTGTWKLLQQDPSKMNNLREIVENSSAVTSKCVVESLLQQVNQLSDVEKLLLYLKLPVGRSADLDPLKQPLNPLGSRTEIQLTITWMKTHLETDLEVSLPKEEVYNEYMDHFTNNGLKPLSTADFGKVMKQVFPSVRARRLGHRGASKYCHSGLRKKYRLDVPSLPDVSETSVPGGGTHTAKNSLGLFGLGVAFEDEVQRAALCIVMEWAEKFCSLKFDTVRDLALFLLEKNYVDTRSVAAFTLLAMHQTPVNSVGKHRETQVQLQKKLQEREQYREQKRKLQEQSGVSKSSSDRPKTRRRSGTTSRGGGPTEGNSGLSRTSLSASGLEASKNSCAVGVQQDSKPPPINVHNGRFELEPCNSMSSKRESHPSRPGMEDDMAPLMATIKKEDTSRIDFPSLLIDDKDDLDKPLGMTSASLGDPETPQTFVRGPPPDEVASNGPSTPVTKTYYMLSNFHTSTPSTPGSTIGSAKNRYKPIQPKLGTLCEPNNSAGAGANAPPITSGAWPEPPTQGMEVFKPQVTQVDYAAPGDAVGLGVAPGILPPAPRVDHEEIVPPQGRTSQAEELSELRKMLQENLPNRPGASCLGMGPLDDPGADLDAEGGGVSPNIRRRVSFQTSSLEGSNPPQSLGALFGVSGVGGGQALSGPSPAYTKAYNFTPIPYPPPAMGGPLSQASSANASPFMSPRNTPLPRSRHNSGQTSSTYVTPRSTPFTPDLGPAGIAPSESSTPFMSPAPTPLISRSRHNSNPSLRNPRSRNASGATNFRHAPYSDEFGRRSSAKFRARHSSGSIPPSPQSAPLSPLVHEVPNPHPLSDPLFFHHQQQQPQMTGASCFGIPFKHQQVSHSGTLGACNDLRRRHMSAGPTIHYQPQQHPTHSFGAVSNCSGLPGGVDLPSQEVSSVMTNPSVGLNFAPSGPTNRPQSVPLPQMHQASSCATEMDYLAKSHPSTPFVGSSFHFGPDCAVPGNLSQTPSYAPTPVPSEYNDFSDYSLDLDPVLAGESTSVNTGLDAIDSSLVPFDATLSDPIAGGPPSSGGVSLTEGVQYANCAGIPGKQFPSQGDENLRTRLQPSSDCSLSRCSGSSLRGGKDGEVAEAVGKAVPGGGESMSCTKGEHNPGTTSQSLMFNASSQITLNALNSNHIIGYHVGETSLEPSSSDLEDDFPPSLVDFGDQEDFNSLVLDVTKD